MLEDLRVPSLGRPCFVVTRPFMNEPSRRRTQLLRKDHAGPPSDSSALQGVSLASKFSSVDNDEETSIINEWNHEEVIAWLKKVNGIPERGGEGVRSLKAIK